MPVGIRTGPGCVGSHSAGNHCGGTLPGNLAILFTQHMCMREPLLCLRLRYDFPLHPEWQRFEQRLSTYFRQFGGETSGCLVLVYRYAAFEENWAGIDSGIDEHDRDAGLAFSL